MLNTEVANLKAELTLTSKAFVVGSYHFGRVTAKRTLDFSRIGYSNFINLQETYSFQNTF